MNEHLQKLKRIAGRLEFWDWVIWFGGGFACLVMAARGANGFLGAMGVLLLVPGIAQVAGHRWAWHAGLVSFVLMCVLWGTVTFGKPLTLWRVVLIGCFAWGLWQHWTDRQRIEALMKGADAAEPDGPPANSLVLWLRGPRFLDAQILSAAATRALGVRFDDTEDADGFVVGKENQFILRYEGMWFILHYREENYFHAPDRAAESVRELRRLNAVRDHAVWLSMDFLRGPDDVTTEVVYRTIGSMLGELTDDDVAAVFHPETGRIAPWAPELKTVLSGGQPLEVFDEPAYAPVIRLKGDSAEMLAAVAEARRRWPEFVQAFQAASDRDGFSVKAPVTEGGNTEFIWISVKSIHEGQIHGLLANEPVALGALKLGDFVSVAATELNDWCYPPAKEGERPVGLFTLGAVAS